MAAVARARFFYDLGSPYAWLTAERIGAEVEWVPVLLGGIFAATGRSSWARTDAREGGIAEIERRAAARGLPPLVWPEPWPNDGLLAMRAATAAHALGEDAGRAFALAAFRLHFTEGRPLSDPAAVRDAAVRADLDPEPLLAPTQPTKDALRTATDQAIALGVFGIPSLVTPAGDVVWGDDRIPDPPAAP